MLIWMAIAAGGALGAMGRYAASVMIAAAMGPGWQPLATLSVNMIGCGLMGAAYGLVHSGMGGFSEPIRVFIQVGFLGALTTFSSFALDAAGLFEKGALALAAGYVMASVVLSLAAFMATLAAMRLLAAAAGQ